VAVADELTPAADRPVLRRRRVAAGDDRGGTLPEHAIRRSPADALAGDLAVGQRQPAAVDRDVVVEHASGPALDRAAEVGRVRPLALDEGVRPGGEVAGGEVVPAVLRPAPLHQRLLAADEEGVPPVRRILGHGIERAAVLDRHPPAAVADGHGRADEVPGRHLPHPGVGGGVEGDGHPGVLLVLGVGRVERRLAGQILDADLADAAGPLGGGDAGLRQRGVQGHRQRDVEGDRVAVNGGDGPVPADVHHAGPPAQPAAVLAGEMVHPEGRYPPGRTGVFDGNLVTGLQPGRVRQSQPRGPDRHIGVCDN
jgi:hypothetical protein